MPKARERSAQESTARQIMAHLSLVPIGRHRTRQGLIPLRLIPFGFPGHYTPRDSRWALFSGKPQVLIAAMVSSTG